MLELGDVLSLIWSYGCSVLLNGDGLCDRKYPAGLTWNTKEGDVKTEGDFRDRKVEMVN